jgi:superoxide dismutase, Cu-Zn family
MPSSSSPVRRVLAASTLAVVLTGAWLAVSHQSAEAGTVIGRAELKLAAGTSIGTVTFENPKDGDATVVKVDLKIAVGTFDAQTFHGLHIHANDDASNGAGCVADATRPANTWFVSADGHMKRNANEGHGGHSGDLSGVYLNRDGTVHLEFSIDRFVAGALFDRAVVLHAGADNFGNVPIGTGAAQYIPNASDATTATRNTGNAGDRVACGVIDVK